MHIDVDIIEANKYGRLHSSFKRRIHCILKIFKLFVFLPITEFHKKKLKYKVIKCVHIYIYNNIAAYL